MRTDKEKAVQLRQAGKSYKQIREETGIPLGTLAGWFKNVAWSAELKNKLSQEVSLSNPKALKKLAQANRVRWNLKREDYRKSAIIEFNKFKHDSLFLAGVMLYWGEGEKRAQSSRVSLSSSEPEMIKIFNLFLTKVLKISQDKIFASLLLYPDLVEPVQKNFWSIATNLPAEQFKKATYLRGKISKKRRSYGTCTIFVSSRSLKERLLKWLELYKNHLETHSVLLEK